jgi:hypothetical protein
MCARAIDRRRGVQGAIGVATAVALFARVAVAAPPDPAEPLIEQGVKLRIEGKHAEALEIFTKAHAASPSARTLAQIGLAEGSLRRWVDAEAHISAALAEHDTPWIENRRNREALEQALSSVRGHIGTVLVVGPPGAEVSVDGKAAGHLPLPATIRAEEGTVRVRGSALGRKPADVEVAVAGGAETTVTLELGPDVPPPFSVPIIDDEPSPPPSTPAWKTWTGASLLAASAAALVAGGVWLAVDGRGTCDAPSGALCLHVYETKAQGWAAIAAGGAVGIAGGLLLWRGHRADASLTAGPGEIGLRGQF